MYARGEEQVSDEDFKRRFIVSSDPEEHVARISELVQPVNGDVVETPEQRRDGLLAHLFGDRDAIGFDFAVGMIGAGADPQRAFRFQQHELHFAA